MFDAIDLFCSLNFTLRHIYAHPEIREVDLGELSWKQQVSATEYGFLVEAKVVRDIISFKDELLCVFKKADACVPGWYSEIENVVAQKHNGPVYDCSVTLETARGLKIIVFINVKASTQENHCRLCSLAEFKKMADVIKTNEIAVLFVKLNSFDFVELARGFLQQRKKYYINDVTVKNVKWASKISTDGTSVFAEFKGYPQLDMVPLRYSLVHAFIEPIAPEEYYKGIVVSTEAFDKFVSLLA